jgi:uncharacterized Zn finger protein
MGWGRDWAPYVPVAQRRAQAAREIAKLDKKGNGKGPSRCPVRIVGRRMATTFWGEAWCTNLESYSDYSNRLPRGRSYARNGSIVDLQIEKGTITALVSGSSLYRIVIQIKTLAPKHWHCIKFDCSQSIHSMMDLLRGKLSNAVLQRLTSPTIGLFPQPSEIDFKCSCPDSAYLCKHLAAVMYGIGNRLDSAPELFFLLRGVEQNELISEVVTNPAFGESFSSQAKSKSSRKGLDEEDLGELFGIDLVSSPSATMTKANKKAVPKPKPLKPVASKSENAKPAVVQAAKVLNTKQKSVEPAIKRMVPGLSVSLKEAMEKLEAIDRPKLQSKSTKSARRATAKVAVGVEVKTKTKSKGKKAESNVKPKKPK